MMESHSDETTQEGQWLNVVKIRKTASSSAEHVPLCSVFKDTFINLSQRDILLGFYKTREGNRTFLYKLRENERCAFIARLLLLCGRRWSPL